MNDEQNIVVENELLRRGFTSIPNYIFGMPISSNAKLIYMALLSYAWTNHSCYPGLAKLCSDVSLSDKPVTKAIEELSTVGLLEVKRRGQGKTNIYIIKDFNALEPSPNSSESRIGESPNQESEILRIKNRKNSESKIGDSPKPEPENLRFPNKEKNTKKKTQGKTHTQQSPQPRATAAAAYAVGGVGVGSKFSLEECRQYAVHLQSTGQGITNPGGYALTIYRSGEVDDFIDDYLNKKIQKSVPSNSDISQCPDCHGTGYWYPKGTSMGVAKCKHERLTDDSIPKPKSTGNIRLKPNEVIEYSAMVADLLNGGYTSEQATLQLGGGFYPEDWNMILTATVTKQNGNGS